MRIYSSAVFPQGWREMQRKEGSLQPFPLFCLEGQIVETAGGKMGGRRKRRVARERRFSGVKVGVGSE